MVLNNIALCLSIGLLSCSVIDNASAALYPNDDGRFDRLEGQQNVNVVNHVNLNDVINRANNGNQEAIDQLGLLSSINNEAFDALTQIAENGNNRAIMHLDSLFNNYGNAEALNAIIRCANNDIHAAFLYLGTIAFNNNDALECLVRCAARGSESALGELIYIGQHCDNANTAFVLLGSLFYLANNGNQAANRALSSIANFSRVDATRTRARDLMQQLTANGN